ncbi:MAG: 4-phosphoerythronate dehydrogenase [Zetaproteobacteria bacterium]|nr:MAG: 4-phosphoerythronate dehydrogenase [Zetaproteobacteria bacterium]
MKRLRIVADAHIHAVREAFSHIPDHQIELRVLEHQDITRQALRHADVLITRSSTQVNARLLDDTPVRFVATATIGDDHFDKSYLQRRGIHHANAAGSSTGSVVEYMLTVLLELHMRGVLHLPAATIGIIGAGRIGGALARVCRRLGLQVLLNDPPRARREGASGFETLSELLARADLLSLHTPLTHHGLDATHHLLGEAQLATFKGDIIINAARGACIDNQALLGWLNADRRHFAVLDCWEHEPAPNPRLVQHPQMLLATPHIAGHSLDGKAANTWYAYCALCRWLGVSPSWNMATSLPEPPAPATIARSGDPWHAVHQAAVALYPIQRDHDRMQTIARLPESERGQAFTRYRRHYPVRRAWHRQGVRFLEPDARTVQLATMLGMRVIEETP